MAFIFNEKNISYKKNQQFVLFGYFLVLMFCYMGIISY